MFALENFTPLNRSDPYSTDSCLRWPKPDATLTSVFEDAREVLYYCDYRPDIQILSSIPRCVIKGTAQPVDLLKNVYVRCLSMILQQQCQQSYRATRAWKLLSWALVLARVKLISTSSKGVSNRHCGWTRMFLVIKKL